MKQEEHWSSTLGFLFAAIGAAIGLGNIWRFSAVVGENGGGAYLIPYFIAAFAFGVPLMILEMSVGRDLRADVVSAFRRIRRRYEIIGWVISGTVLVVLSYYLVITGWVLAYLLYAIADRYPAFEAFTSTYLPVDAFVICTVAAGMIVSFGVQKGIERVAKLLIPLVFVVLFGLAIYAITLPGFGQGMAFFLTPDFAVLTDPLIWSAAIGQVFFSLSVGQGIMLTYGSYLSDRTNIPRSSLIITTADLTVALLAGIVIFPIVFSFGLEPAMGTELAFSTLPQAFATMPFGQVIGIAFFGALFVAAITPSVSMLEVGVAALGRATTLQRGSASVIMTMIVLVLGLPSALSYSAFDLTLFGQRVLDLLDDTVGTLGLPITAFVIAIMFMWLQDDATVERQIGHSLLRPLLRFLVPGVLLAVTALRLIQNTDVPAWHHLPDGVILNALLRIELTLGLGLVLLAVGVAITRLRRG